MEPPSSSAASRDRVLAAGKQWHKVLGVASTSCQDDVKKAYRQLVLLHHPDKPGGDADTFRIVHEAYVLALRKCRKSACLLPKQSPVKSNCKASPKASPKKKAQKKETGRARAKPKAKRAHAPKAAAKQDAESASTPEPKAARKRPTPVVEEAAPPPKRVRVKKWLVAEDAGKAKIRKAVEQWVSCTKREETMMPDDIRSVPPQELCSLIRATKCVPVDVRDVGVDGGMAMQGAERLSYCQLLSNPEELVPKIAKLRQAGKPAVFFSDQGGRMGRCALIGAILIDVFGLEEESVLRLDGGYVAWDAWLEANRDQARTVEPLALRLQRRRAAAAIRFHCMYVRRCTCNRLRSPRLMSHDDQRFLRCLQIHLEKISGLVSCHLSGELCEAELQHFEATCPKGSFIACKRQSPPVACEKEADGDEEDEVPSGLSGTTEHAVPFGLPAPPIFAHSTTERDSSITAAISHRRNSVHYRSSVRATRPGLGLVARASRCDAAMVSHWMDRSEEYLLAQFKRLKNSKSNRIDATGFLELAATYGTDDPLDVGLLPKALAHIRDAAATGKLRDEAWDDGVHEIKLNADEFMALATFDFPVASVGKDISHTIDGIRCVFAKEADAKAKATEHELLDAAMSRMASRALRTQTIPNVVKDVFVTIIIFVNALVMGISADVHEGARYWDYLELFFTVFYTLEALDKLRGHGCWWYFCGPDSIWNYFDLAVVVIAYVELALAFLATQTEVSFAGWIKMVRLLRIARMLKLLRFQFFSELKQMVLGVCFGLRVLFWAIVLFAFFIFVLGLLLRQLIGEDEPLNKYTSNFGTMSRSMFTLFRCFTEGCTADDGTPLTVHLIRQYGAPFLIAYTCTYLFVTIGLFNLIMAIFVENVTESNRQRRQQARAGDSDMVREKMRSMVKSLTKDRSYFLQRKTTQSTNGSMGLVESCKRTVRQWSSSFMKDRMRSLTKLADPSTGRRSHGLSDDGNRDDIVVITRDVFHAWLMDDDFVGMLDELDIAQSCRWDLFDVLDADMSGELEMEELIEGLMKLRGPAEKSDAVASLLSTRVILSMLKDFVRVTDEHRNDLSTMQVETKDAVGSLKMLVQQSSGDLSAVASKPTRTRKSVQAAVKPSAKQLPVVEHDAGKQSRLSI